MLLPAGAWVSARNVTGEWIQADLETTHLIESVTTQGRSGRFGQWVTSYHVSYSPDGSDWVDLSMPYSGNVDQDSKVTNRLPANTLARHVRLRPNGWQDSIAMRFTVTGCGAIRKISLSSIVTPITKQLKNSRKKEIANL